MDMRIFNNSPARLEPVPMISVMGSLTNLYEGLRDAIVLERIRVPRDHRRMAKFVRAVAPALDGIAMIRGSEDFLISLDGSEEDSVRCYAKFLLMTLHPHGIPPPIPVDVPWHRPHNDSPWA